MAKKGPLFQGSGIVPWAEVCVSWYIYSLFFIFSSFSLLNYHYHKHAYPEPFELLSCDQQKRSCTLVFLCTYQGFGPPGLFHPLHFGRGFQGDQNVSVINKLRCKARAVCKVFFFPECWCIPSYALALKKFACANVFFQWDFSHVKLHQDMSTMNHLNAFSPAVFWNVNMSGKVLQNKVLGVATYVIEIYVCEDIQCVWSKKLWSCSLYPFLVIAAHEKDRWTLYQLTYIKVWVATSLLTIRHDEKQMHSSDWLWEGRRPNHSLGQGVLRDKKHRPCHSFWRLWTWGAAQ